MTFFKVLSFIIFILLSVLLVNSETNLGTADTWDFSTPDLVCKFRATQNDGIETTMEAFSAVSNNQSLTASNETHLLKWITAGYPTILKRHIIDDLNFNYIIHTSPQGFYMAVDMLTSNQISLLMKEIELKYNINVKPSQFIVLPPSSFTCVLHLLNDNGLQSTLNGAVRNVSSSSHPSILIIDFLLDKTSAEYQLLFNPLNNKINMSMNCSFTSLFVTHKKQPLILTKSLADNLGLTKNIFHESKPKTTKLVTLTQLKVISAEIFKLLNISDDYGIQSDEFETLFMSHVVNHVAVNKTNPWVPFKQDELEKFSLFGATSIGKLTVEIIKSALQELFSVSPGLRGQILVANNDRFTSFVKLFQDNLTKLFNIEEPFTYVYTQYPKWKTGKKSVKQQLDDLNFEYPQSDIKWCLKDENITIEAIQVVELSYDKFIDGLTFESLFKMVKMFAVQRNFLFLLRETDLRVNLLQEIVKPFESQISILNETIKELQLKLEEQHRELINRTAKPRWKCKTGVLQWSTRGYSGSSSTKGRVHLLFNQRKTRLFTGSFNNNKITVFDVTNRTGQSFSTVHCADKARSISLNNADVNSSEDTFLVGSWNGKLYSANYSFKSENVTCNLLLAINHSSSINGIYQDKQDKTIWFVNWNAVYNNKNVLNGTALPVYTVTQECQDTKDSQIYDIISQEAEIYLLYTTKIRVLDKSTMTTNRIFGQFQSALLFRRDNTGQFAVCDYLGNKVIIINDDGEFITEILLKRPTGVEWDYDNRLLYVMTEYYEINCYAV